MRRAVTPAIPPSMYRHFAVVTVVLTAGLAMFADGENREAQAVQAAQAQPAPSASPVAFATAAPARRQSTGGWSDADFDAAFGAPMEALFGGGGSSLVPELDDVNAPGYSPEYLASLSDAERELLLQGLRENGMLEPDILSRRRTALAAASDRRSGAATRGE